MTHGIIAKIYQHGFVLVQFRTTYDALIWFVCIEHGDLIASFDNEAEAEECFRELTK